ncbi:hypothetical protein ACOMHN_036414 [Nucella lapillus]
MVKRQKETPHGKNTPGSVATRHLPPSSRSPQIVRRRGATNGVDGRGFSAAAQEGGSREPSPVSKGGLEGYPSPHDHQDSLMETDASREYQEDFSSKLDPKEEPDTDDVGFDSSQCNGQNEHFLYSPPHSSAFLDISSALSGCVRKQREFTPDNRKDQSYWEKRRKNNEAARKSREKRRLHDMLLENRIMDLEEDNSRLRAELRSLKTRYGIPLDVRFTELQRDEESFLDDPSSSHGSVGYSARSGESGGVVPPPALSLIGGNPSHPPVLTLPARVGVPGVFQAEAVAPIPFFVPAPLPAEPPLAHTVSTPPVVTPHTLIPFAHQHGCLVVKRECVDDKAPPCFRTFQEEGLREAYSQYIQGSPPGTVTPATVAAHFGWSEVMPGAGHGSAAHPWRRKSPVSSHSSEDTGDEPLQLTVHRRGSKTESVEGDFCSGSEGIKDVYGHTNCSREMYANTQDRFSPPHYALPLKLRHKIALDASWPHHITPAGMNGAFGSSLTSSLTPGGVSRTEHCPINGFMSAGGGISPTEPSPITGQTTPPEPTVTQDSPLPLVKNEPQPPTLEAPHQDSSSDNHHRNNQDPKYQDPKYLERRRRNNEAARKCRANRRKLSRLHEAKSDYLQSENGQLRQELDVLQEEMKQLRSLLEQKSQQGTSQDQQVLAEQQTQRLRELEEEHRVLKELQQGRLTEKRREKEAGSVRRGVTV